MVVILSFCLKKIDVIFSKEIISIMILIEWCEYSLIFYLPLGLHSPFSKSNIQFPLQPWLSKLLFEFGQYVQSGYNISPPQDTVTEYQGSIDFVGSRCLRIQILNVLTNLIFLSSYLYYTIFSFQWDFEDWLFLYTTHRIHRSLWVEMFFQPCKECHFFLAVHFQFDSNILWCGWHE